MRRTIAAHSEDSLRKVRESIENQETLTAPCLSSGQCRQVIYNIYSTLGRVRDK